jgi:signal transduction histidine kinase
LKNPETIGMFKLFVELIAAHLNADEALRRSQAELAQERQLSEFREQFIAVLGHDLRNPLASIDAGVKMLQRANADDKSRQILSLMKASVSRMGGLIDNVLDFARARLGEGLDLRLSGEKPLTPLLEEVVAELRSIWPDRIIEANFNLAQPIAVDRERVAQLFSNLLGNALIHGADAPVRTGATIEGGVFELWVSNGGAPIPAEALPGLFRPFFRGKRRKDSEGLGLGLYIVSEIARAHGGALTVASDATETRFTFRMPFT